MGIPAGTTELVRLGGVTKVFPGVRALDGVDLSIRAGEVLALVGENGAGKSTLMKVLSGVYPAGSFEGVIEIDGVPVRFRSPREAERAGIAIIHQELSAFPHLTVAENLFVGHWPRKRFGGRVDWARLQGEAQKYLDEIGAKCRASDRMGDLSVGAQQMVEIAKALTRRSRVLILDEPTSALTPSEVEALFVVIRKLKAQGKGLVYISHKMEEIYAIADRITVLRDGKSVTTAPTAGLPERQLIAHMVGRSLDRAFPDRPPFVTGVADTLLSVHEFSGFGKSTLGSAGAGPVSGMRRLFGPLSFELKRGEILGFAGLLGAGRTDLMEALFGNAQRIQTEGEVKIGGTSVRVRTPGEGLRNRLAFVSEDRKHQSILPKRSLTENVTLSRLTLGGLFRVLDGAREAKLADVSLRRFRTRCTGPAQEIQTLSGGNQQKAVIGRALQTNPDIIILDEPTRGIDVAAKYEIYEILFDLAAQGKGLLVVSSDLPEAMGLCDRIIVLNQGEYMGCLSRHEFSQPAIMELAIGRTHGRR